MRTLMAPILCLVAFGACKAAAAPLPPPPPAESTPELRPEMRIVSIPVNDDLEELGSFSKMGLPLDVFATITAGEEPLVARVVSRATIISMSKGADHTTSLMLAVPRDDVEMLILTRDLVRRRQASFYLAAGPRNAPSSVAGKDKTLQLRQMLTRMGYEMPEHRPTPVPPTAPSPAPASLASPAASPEATAPKAPASPAPEALSMPERVPEGRVLMDGSSTVFPMAKLVRDEFMRRYPGVELDLMGINLGESPSGTGGGFKKFCFGETDISNASRMMKDEEVRKCAANNISFLEIPLAYDGLSVVVSRANTWVKSLTLADLKAIWAQDSKIQTWRDLRPEFPLTSIKLFGPGRDSGTFDYFTEAVFGKTGPVRPDAVASEDDEVLVKGIAGSPGGLGYFGLAYYIEHQDALKLVPIDGGKGPIVPTNETVLDGSYSPFSRPLFIYVNAKSLKRPEVQAYTRYFVRESSRVAQAVGYIPLPADLRRLAQERLLRNVEGSMRPLGQPAGTLRAMLAKS
jgi:phosphate transport system substrate-binding protein